MIPCEVISSIVANEVSVYSFVTNKKWFKPYCLDRWVNDLTVGKHPVVKWLEQVKHTGNKAAAKADVTAFYEEVYKAGSKFAFSWNQLYTHLPEDEGLRG